MSALTLAQAADCNNNGLPDIEEISSGRSYDLNSDGVLDECTQPSPWPRIRCMAISRAANLCNVWDTVDGLGWNVYVSRNGVQGALVNSGANNPRAEICLRPGINELTFFANSEQCAPDDPTLTLWMTDGTAASISGTTGSPSRPFGGPVHNPLFGPSVGANTVSSTSGAWLVELKSFEWNIVGGVNRVSYETPVPDSHGDTVGRAVIAVGCDRNGDNTLDETELHAQPATIYGIQPISGPADGGTRVTIFGADFTPDATVIIGSRPATEVSYVSPTTLTAVTPPGVPGVATIFVNCAKSDAFYYRPYCGSDLDQNGAVDGGDMAILLLDWGPCYTTPSALAAPAPTPLLVPDEATPASTPPAPQSARPTPQPRGTAS